MSKLGSWLEAEMKARGWSYRAAEKHTGISKSVLEDIVKVSDFEPRLGVLARLAEATSMPLWQLLELQGQDSGVSNSFSWEGERIANLLRTKPEAKPVLEHLTQLSPEQIKTILAVLEKIEL